MKACSTGGQATGVLSEEHNATRLLVETSPIRYIWL